MRILWLIDDTPMLHGVAQATVDLVYGWTYAGWLSGEEAITELQAGAAWPDVVLMDYYIGSERGDRITRHLRALEPAQHRPVIIGYSSVRSASQAIVAAGADLILPKHQDARGINPSLLAWLHARR
jgi:CheY-like chemotaxis protein